ncbi:hypothetical protein [Asticcacaulis sp. YBE204]|uniref:hypothetical protein n=1 Tax=Asticcacaulis sp. YBE204 TaxID=1282363 RepID=UPI0003C3B2C6|nr:hypothetical protein [Asticcacaulis sp. YBE204]ESQ79599.1 hypothetical protein AEYBE204_07085 [Asticcacaulis sp. YBE204]
MTSIALDRANTPIFTPIQQSLIGLLALGLALAVHWLAFADLRAMPCSASDTCLLPLEPICDCGIPIDIVAPPPDWRRVIYGICDCIAPPPRLQSAASKPTDIDYVHFPTGAEAAVARGNLVVSERTFVTVTCTATPEGRLQDCTAVSPSPLVEATVRLFETSTQVKPVGGITATAPYVVRLTYVWEAVV